jgi:hypothetical protein
MDRFDDNHYRYFDQRHAGVTLKEPRCKCGAKYSSRGDYKFKVYGEWVCDSCARDYLNGDLDQAEEEEIA